MKKHLFFYLLTLPFWVFAQFSENFDGGTTFPTGWSVINGGGTNTFVIGPASAGSALSAPNSVYIIYNATAHDDYLVTPQINVTAGVSDRLTFFVKNQDPLYVEQYEVKLSNTNNTSAAAFTTTLKSLGDAPNAWTQVILDLTPYVGQQVYIGFHAVSTDKFRLHFDNIVNDTAPTTAPACATLTAPAASATGISYQSATLSWAAAPGASSYDVYMDTNANPTTLLVNTAGTSHTLTNLAGNTTYYWKVVPKNNIGSAANCEIRSFTTAVNPVAPYCGPLPFSTPEPITLVNFAGINNATSETVTGAQPHEVFMGITASVMQGSTYPIILKGNTNGNYTNRFIVFIDWNQDGDFGDAGETYFSGTADMNIVNSTGIDAVQAQGNIAVPATAAVGNTRMRVKKLFGTTNFTDPCAGGTWGQAEDYTVTVALLGTDEISKSKSNVYPNPVKDILNVANAKEKITEVSVYSLSGQLIKTTKLNGNKTEIDFSKLSKGIYIIKVKTSSTENSFKIIKE